MRVMAGQTRGAHMKPNPQLRHVQDPGPSTAAANAFRRGARAAGLDLEALGVRDRGPLDWTPPDLDEGEVEPPVAVARRRHLARCRLAEIERRRREMRQVARFWQGAA